MFNERSARYLVFRTRLPPRYRSHDRLRILTKCHMSCQKGANDVAHEFDVKTNENFITRESTALLTISSIPCNKFLPFERMTERKINNRFKFVKNVQFPEIFFARVARLECGELRLKLFARQVVSNLNTPPEGRISRYLKRITGCVPSDASKLQGS